MCVCCDLANDRGVAAFGIFARALESKPEFAKIREMASGLELADSITVDGHKLLNVVCWHQHPLHPPFCYMKQRVTNIV